MKLTNRKIRALWQDSDGSLIAQVDECLKHAGEDVITVFEVSDGRNDEVIIFDNWRTAFQRYFDIGFGREITE